MGGDGGDYVARSAFRKIVFVTGNFRAMFVRYSLLNAMPVRLKYALVAVAGALSILGCAQFDSQGSPIGFLLFGGGSSGGGSSTVANWSASDFGCRQQVTISASSAIAASTLVTFSFDHASLVSAGKSLASGDDVRVYYEDGSGTELDRALVSGSSWNASSTKLAVKAQAAIAAGGSDSNYYLYYCNSSASSPPTSVPAGNTATTESTGTQTANTVAYSNVASSSFTPTATDEVWIWFVTFGIKTDAAQNNSSESFLARVTLNGGTDTEVEQMTNAGDHYRMQIVTGFVTGTTSTQTIGVDIKQETDNGSLTSIKNLRIVAMLLPADADFQSAQDDTETAATTAWTTVGPALTFTPSSAGDYYIVASGQFHELPSSSTAEMRLLSHDASNWPPVGADARYSVNGRGAFDTFFVMRKETLTAAAKTFQFEFQSSGGGAGSSEYKGLRLYAFRADAFESAESQEDVAASGTTSTAEVTKSTLTTSTPSGARDHVIIQSQWVYDTDSTSTHQTNADFTLDGTVISDQDHALDHSSYHFSSAAVHSLNTASSVTLLNRYWTNNAGISTFSKESVIHVLRFKDVDESLGGEETN